LFIEVVDRPEEKFQFLLIVVLIIKLLNVLQQLLKVFHEVAENDDSKQEY
jgi:hypothetical protein